jgi:DNA polymerase-3 subunit epsilon
MHAFDEPLVFVDIETNGLSPTTGRVIEVAAIRVENGTVTREFNQLVNPGTSLPWFITNLTGITEQDVAKAPAFSHLADELHRVMEGAIFVAHNVRFDHSFLREEYNRLGVLFDPKLLCTVRLSRALYPEHKSHKLANLIERHGFSYSARHRAYDDAHILWQFMQHVTTQFEQPILHAALAKQLR